MKRLLLPWFVAASVLAGVVLSSFASSASPGYYLWRPLGVAMTLGLVIGAISLLARRFAPIVAAAIAVLVVGGSHLWVLLVVAATLLFVLAAERFHWRVDPGGPLVAAAGVFLVVGVVRAAPLIPEPHPDSTGSVSGSPTYLILLDSYPRPDSLADLDIDISPFLTALKSRGFDYYPDAQTVDGWTHRTIARMLDQPLEGADVSGDSREKLRIRSRFRLPDGFVVIAPPIGHVTFPTEADIGSGGLTSLDIHLIGQGLFARFDPVGDWVMEDLRDRVDESFDALAQTEEDFVFAHILAPHQPFLFGPDGAGDPPDCWPGCDLFGVHTLTGLEETLTWLNQRVVETVDDLILRHPDARIVVFSDHGGRFGEFEPGSEWYRTLLLARTPGQSRLLDNDPSPTSLVSRLLDNRTVER